MNKDAKKKKDGKTSSSILIGVLVCFVLIAVYGIFSQSKVSFAFPEALEKLDANKVDQITTKTTDDFVIDSPSTDMSSLISKMTLDGKIIGETTVNEKVYQIDMFGLETLKNPPTADLIYKKYNVNSDEKIVIDEGVYAIIIDAYKNVSIKEEDGKTIISLNNKDYYKAQMAIWIYQNGIYKEGYTRPTNLDDAANTKMQKLEDLWSYIKQNNTSEDSKTIYYYLQIADNAKNSTTNNSIKVVGDNKKIEFNLTTDQKYYETELIQVEITKKVNTEFIGFNFTINSNDSNVPVNVIDENGTKIEDLTQLENGKKFKLQLEKSSLPANTNVKTSGNVTGKFNHMGFATYLKYDTTSNQYDKQFQVALLAANTSNIETAKIDLDIVVPNTGAGNTGYIYIIGALVLIVGLTIIYVNTKVQKN